MFPSDEEYELIALKHKLVALVKKWRNGDHIARHACAYELEKALEKDDRFAKVPEL